MSDDDTEYIQWQATCDLTTGAPALVMTWGPKTRVYPIDRALATARDLYAAASAAEHDAALFETLTKGALRLESSIAEQMMLEVRRHRTALQERPAAKPIYRIGAAFGHHTRRALVAIHLGSQDVLCSPEEARMEADAIYECAAGAVIDARIRHVLGERGVDIVAVEEILAAMMALGKNNGLVPPAAT